MNQQLANYYAGVQDKLARALGGVGPDYDYGLAGKMAANGHSSDAGKLPWHPTFSTESAYSNAKTPGGTWETKIINGEKKQTYTPSAWMVQNGLAEGLAEYMKRVEPNVVLQMPAPYKEQ